MDELVLFSANEEVLTTIIFLCEFICIGVRLMQQMNLGSLGRAFRMMFQKLDFIQKIFNILEDLFLGDENDGKYIFSNLI